MFFAVSTELAGAATEQLVVSRRKEELVTREASSNIIEAIRANPVDGWVWEWWQLRNGERVLCGAERAADDGSRNAVAGVRVDGGDRFEPIPERCRVHAEQF